MADSAQSPRKTKTGSKKVVPKKPAEHPKYLDMIIAAIVSLKERTGSSRQAIAKFVKANYKVGENCDSHLKQALRRGVINLELKQMKGTGASGSFKVTADAQKKAATTAKPAKKPAARKPKTKTAAKPKKPAAKSKTPKKTPTKPKPTKKTTAAKKASASKPKKAAKKAPAKKAPAKKPAKKTPKKKAGKKTAKK